MNCAGPFHTKNQMDETKKVKLSGGFEKTVTWIWLESGQLKIEFYDFSETAQRMFGNDIAYTITVKEMDKLYLHARQNEGTLIQWLRENFKSYFGIRQWLEEEKISFDIDTESWA